MRIRLHSAPDAIALVIVMIVIFVLAILAGTFATSMKVEMHLARSANYETELEWLGRAGVERAKYFIVEQMRIPGQGSYNSLNQRWAGGPGGTNDLFAEIPRQEELGNGRFSVTIEDQERKLNVNLLDRDPQMLQIFQQALDLIGVEPASYSVITDSLLDWLDPDGPRQLSGAESDYYLSLEPPYRAKNGPLDHISELLLVRGVTPAMYWGSALHQHTYSAFQPPPTGFAADEEPIYNVGLVDIFTAISNGKINVNTAPVTTLQLIPGADEVFVSFILERRRGLDQEDGTEDDVPFTSLGQLAIPGANPALANQLMRYCDVLSHTFEVYVDAEVKGVKRRYTALLRRVANNDLQIYRFSWE
jgi:general secretion pathway protein K